MWLHHIQEDLSIYRYWKIDQFPSLSAETENYTKFECYYKINVIKRLIKACPASSDKSFLRKHAYSNILKISPPKTESFQIKILIYFYSKHRL